VLGQSGIALKLRPAGPGFPVSPGPGRPAIVRNRAWCCQCRAGRQDGRHSHQDPRQNPPWPPAVAAGARTPCKFPSNPPATSNAGSTSACRRSSWSPASAVACARSRVPPGSRASARARCRPG